MGFIQDLTVDVVAFMSIKRLRMQIENFTAYSNMDVFKVTFNDNFNVLSDDKLFQSNLTGLAGELWVGRAINRLVNRIIERSAPRIFDINQKLFNLAIRNIVVPRINKILSMYSVILPSTKIGLDSSSYNGTVYLMELSKKKIFKLLKKYPISYPENDQATIDKLFHENFVEK